MYAARGAGNQNFSLASGVQRVKKIETNCSRQNQLQPAAFDACWRRKREDVGEAAAVAAAVVTANIRNAEGEGMWTDP
jgi:hypothetical protein